MCSVGRKWTDGLDYKVHQRFKNEKTECEERESKRERETIGKRKVYVQGV